MCIFAFSWDQPPPPPQHRRAFRLDIAKNRPSAEQYWYAAANPTRLGHFLDHFSNHHCLDPVELEIETTLDRIAQHIRHAGRCPICPKRWRLQN
jgi:hypothetical protein